MSEYKEVKVFYSWQSDTNRDCNWQAILNALRQAIVIIEEAHPDTRIVIEEATSNLTGSPNIPASIFMKIAAADIFICDITTINHEATTRRTPNPNVLLELGYAVAILGWDRIVLVFNKAFGAFPGDVPFDIDRHRIADYLVSDKSDSNGKGQLRTLLIKAIGDIIRADPKRPSIYRANEMKKREQDIKTLTSMLSNIYLPLFDKFLYEAPKQLDTRILHYWEGFNSILSSARFHVHDKTALDLIIKVHSAWGRSLSYSHRYRDSSIKGMQIFGVSKGDWMQAKNVEERKERLREYYKEESIQEDELRILEAVISELRECSILFLKYIQEHFLEIDLEKTSEAALANYKSYYEKN